MIKRGNFLFFVFCLVVIVLLVFVNAQSKDLKALDTVDVKDSIKKAKNTGEEIIEFTKKDKWEYLGEQWKSFLLKSKFVSGVDGFFKKINFVFVFLFRENYDLSLSLFFIIILWIFTFLFYGKIFRNFSTFSGLISYIISFAISIVSSQIGIYNLFSGFILNIIFFKEGIWRWVSFLVYLLILILIITYLNSIINSIKKHINKRLKERERFEQEVLHKTVEGIEEANKDV